MMQRPSGFFHAGAISGSCAELQLVLALVVMQLTCRVSSRCPYAFVCVCVFACATLAQQFDSCATGAIAFAWQGSAKAMSRRMRQDSRVSWPTVRAGRDECFLGGARSLRAEGRLQWTTLPLKARSVVLAGQFVAKALQGGAAGSPLTRATCWAREPLCGRQPRARVQIAARVRIGGRAVSVCVRHSLGNAAASTDGGVRASCFRGGVYVAERLRSEVALTTSS